MRIGSIGRLSLLALSVAILITISCSRESPKESPPADGALVVELVHLKDSDPTPEWPQVFNEGRPFVISVNEGIPNARAFFDALVGSLKSQDVLDDVVFSWFGGDDMEFAEVIIGSKVELGIAQSVLRSYGQHVTKPMIISVATEDEKLGKTQSIYVGGLVASGRRVVSPPKLRELTAPGLTHEEFLRLLD